MPNLINLLDFVTQKTRGHFLKKYGNFYSFMAIKVRTTTLSMSNRFFVF